MNSETIPISFVNGYVACAPFAKVTADIKVRRGVATMENRTTLACSPAVADASFKDRSGADVVVPTGARVYVRGESVVNHPWSTAVFHVEGLPDFVLVPFDQICAVG